MAAMDSSTYLQVDLHLLMIVICQRFGRKPKEIEDGVPLCSWKVIMRQRFKLLREILKLC
ncbi:hypothetical protein LINPERPRIM_LOCUS22447, partial [Linum perenne]